ncbi:L-2-hydroxyglutarate oxidase [Bacillus sp. ISL-47]|uniref:L-2-hydroxyglutarate oxidase n=1 Tax=Bacillus sp. ISL-47 TaxID=2819130 RepID=UPI001BE82074|nr:L-2-hydroxyglutarate oxidase [Bacillus sp. ISL-47]MBT2688065.1 L-2-hydroxyglutarate oxidase [Bacillus sp. ISL-47]MBT2707925.1 L-2-hydroxyglutarate oxidase [Pseudomonas sp. ISL-84]
MYDYIIIGGGIVGLSTGMALQERFPSAKIAILEKEAKLASHQTGNNSGVIHSGIYYKPGSLKAKLAKSGNETMRRFCESKEIQHDICGKVIVAADKQELPHLENLYKRGLDNGLDIRKFSQEELREREPHVNGIEAIYVPQAGIVNYKEVCEKIGESIQEKDGEIFLNQRVRSISELADEVIIETDQSSFRGKYLINCAGLHSDRIAKMAGYIIDMQIVPFRGEYFQIKPERLGLVKNLIYPVPNPDFPFLGVHFTRMIDGKVDVGPNAVLSFKREGYKKTDFHLTDTAEILKFQGFWKLAGKYMKEGMDEMIRSFSKKKFVENAQRLLPELREDDLIPGPAGVRAQALTKDGSLVDDFQIINGKNSTHVCNAPSPAATASLEIGKIIAKGIPDKTVLMKA